MQTALKDNRARQPRRFKVGLVGASDSQRDVLSRIFTVTQYRTRCYEAVPLDPNQLRAKRDVDFVLMCSNSQTVVNAWARQADHEKTSARPLILLSHPNARVTGKYQLNSPINPGKLIKLLDRYTIKELNFFPEFEIGTESDQMDETAISGINILRSGTEKNAAQGESRRALVVDDSLAVRKQMQIEFELLNDTVDLVDSAESAMLAVERLRYDIIFLDVVMPGMDGYTACKKIKRCRLNRETPVVMLTSRSSSFDKIKGSLAGCSAYLVKPVNHNEFEAVYRKHARDPSPGTKDYLRSHSRERSHASQQNFGS
ncbi:MAG: response regulator [Cellvibrionaceae bacterium]